MHIDEMVANLGGTELLKPLEGKVVLHFYS
jgi:hypothetical protein